MYKGRRKALKPGGPSTIRPTLSFSKDALNCSQSRSRRPWPGPKSLKRASATPAAHLGSRRHYHKFRSSCCREFSSSRNRRRSAQVKTAHDLGAHASRLAVSCCAGLGFGSGTAQACQSLRTSRENRSATRTVL